MTLAQQIILDALEFFLEMLEEDPIPRTENKPYTVRDVRAVTRQFQEGL